MAAVKKGDITINQNEVSKEVWDGVVELARQNVIEQLKTSFDIGIVSEFAAKADEEVVVKGLVQGYLNLQQALQTWFLEA